MYRQFNIQQFYPHSVFMCFVWIWEQTAIISLYSINWLVFMTETECVYCAVRTGSLYIKRINLSFSVAQSRRHSTAQRLSVRLLQLHHKTSRSSPISSGASRRHEVVLYRFYVSFKDLVQPTNSSSALSTREHRGVMCRCAVPVAGQVIGNCLEKVVNSKRIGQLRLCDWRVRFLSCIPKFTFYFPFCT